MLSGICFNDTLLLLQRLDRGVLMPNRWGKIYMAGAFVLSVSVIGMIVSGEDRGSPWLMLAIAAAITCVFARWKIWRNRSGR
jgi:hypothetical protein